MPGYRRTAIAAQVKQLRAAGAQKVWRETASGAKAASSFVAPSISSTPATCSMGTPPWRSAYPIERVGACFRTIIDDGGLSGASLDRPALQSLLADVRRQDQHRGGLRGLIPIALAFKLAHRCWLRTQNGDERSLRLMAWGSRAGGVGGASSGWIQSFSSSRCPMARNPEMIAAATREPH
jgi:hypothetical protein